MFHAVTVDGDLHLIIIDVKLANQHNYLIIIIFFTLPENIY